MYVNINNKFYELSNPINLYVLVNEYLNQTKKDVRKISEKEWFKIIEPMVIEEGIIKRVDNHQTIDTYYPILQENVYVPLTEDIDYILDGIEDLAQVEIFALGYHYLNIPRSDYFKKLNGLIESKVVDDINSYLNGVMEAYLECMTELDFNEKGFKLEIFSYDESNSYVLSRTVLKDTKEFNISSFVSLKPINTTIDISHYLACVTRFLKQNPEKFRLNQPIKVNEKVEITIWDNAHRTVSDYGMDGYVDDLPYYMITFKDLNDSNPNVFVHESSIMS